MHQKSQIEHEAKVLGVDTKAITKKLKSIGAKEKSTVLHRRYVFNTIPFNENKWLRLRSDGKKHTITIKQIDDDTITGTKEWETEVANFETMLDILVHSGIKPKAYQENRRTDFLLGKVTISLDEWPKIPPYIEIEGPNEQSVLEVAKKLGYSKDDLTSLNTKKVYLNYGINLDEISELKF